MRVRVLSSESGFPREVAVIDFRGELEVALPGGGARIYNRGRPSGYAVEGAVPDDTVRRIYQEVRMNRVVGEVDGYEWRADG